MATTKKKTTGSDAAAAASARTAPEKPRNLATYDADVAEFAAAVDLFAAGRYQDARVRFEALADRASAEEPILSGRARSYAVVAARRSSEPPAAATEPDALFYRGVHAANAGNLDAAWALLDKALQLAPQDGSIHYARASVRALQGDGESAASELRKAVAIDPKFRFQACSDPDFDRVRDEAAFIDVIEPTSAPRG